jgi:hypothetical protein
MRKQLINIVLVVVAIIVFYLVAVKAKWIPSFTGLFKPAPVLIDETPILIKEIRAISELVTITAYDEVITSSVKPAPAGSVKQLLRYVMPAPVIAIDKIVLVVKGKVVAGVELQKMTDKNIFIKGDSISMQLPPAVILDVIVNPSDTETFMETGSWSSDEVAKVKLKAMNALLIRANEKKLPEKANEQALHVMNDFLKSLGYKKIRVAM